MLMNILGTLIVTQKVKLKRFSLGILKNNQTRGSEKGSYLGL